MSAVLRIAGPLLDVDAVDWVPRDKLETAWRAGDPTITGRVSADSGFTILLTDALDPGRMVREAMKVFLQLAPHLAKLLREGASAEIDFALFVDASQPTSLVFEPGMLQTIEQHQVRIIVTAYPVDGDDESNDDGAEM